MFGKPLTGLSRRVASRDGMQSLGKINNNKCLLTRVGFCTNPPPQSVHEYLDSLGYSDPAIVKGMIAVIANGKPSVMDLQKFGTSGLKSLAAAVEREVEVESQQEHLKDITVYLLGPEKGAKPVKLVGKEGANFYDLHQKDNMLSEMMECACGGIAACSTCHIILDEEDYKKLPELEEAEIDMLDLTEDLTETSRLGCQVALCAALDGKTIRLPTSTKNLF